MRSLRAPAMPKAKKLPPKYLANLGFNPTGAQQRVGNEIAYDLSQHEPMLRLIQGDVGAGKTVVAALAALQALEAGYQVALMAPTEILAEQHFITFKRWLEPLGIEVAWLAGKLKGKNRVAALEQIASGTPMVVGTHALFQDEVQFKNLALVIIDEQHRFGVQQRLALRQKGVGGRMCPHQLIMTATPIPRTLAMSAYADLDTSILDELPPGRTPVNTVLVTDTRRVEVIERVRGACAEGRQAYWVCTLIEESEELTCQAAETTFEDLTLALGELKVGLIHGRMKPVEKAAVMAEFKAGNLQLLVATTVIEVGVDVPNASLMIIENPERLGLAQLHQLRGRVGRGSAASHCVLLYHPPLSQIGRQRLGIMRETNDGFVIAEKDLELRGPGEMLGTRQTGLLQFKVADLMRDADLLPAVRDAAQALLERWPTHVSPLLDRWLRHGQQYGQV
ncbi:ATP-dependent DNA helicase RecG [compost metagenome]